MLSSDFPSEGLDLSGFERLNGDFEGSGMEFRESLGCGRAAAGGAWDEDPPVRVLMGVVLLVSCSPPQKTIRAFKTTPELGGAGTGMFFFVFCLCLFFFSSGVVILFCFFSCKFVVVI